MITVEHVNCYSAILPILKIVFENCGINVDRAPSDFHSQVGLVDKLTSSPIKSKLGNIPLHFTILSH